MNHANPHNYQIPSGIRVYAIGDVHGHVDLLAQMHEAIFADIARDTPEWAVIVTLGDYVDRGPDSRGVIDFLMGQAARDDGVGRVFIRGNHEDGMFDFMREPFSSAWLQWGGIETLRSYGVEFDVDDYAAILPREREDAAAALKAALPKAHVRFLEACVSSHVIGDYLFAHAGVDPLKPLAEQVHKDFSRSRQPFLSWYKEADYAPLEKRVVHGHTIGKEPIERPHRVGVDTGAYESGVLSAAVVEGGEIRFLQVGAG
ncbi:MAG: metallophosphoesterase [Alphaproteobacteria bacterium]